MRSVMCGAGCTVHPGPAQCGIPGAVGGALVGRGGCGDEGFGVGQVVLGVAGSSGLASPASRTVTALSRADRAYWRRRCGVAGGAGGVDVGAGVASTAVVLGPALRLLMGSWSVTAQGVGGEGHGCSPPFVCGVCCAG